MSKKFLVTILTLIVILAAGGFAIFLAKGYRLSPKTGTVSGTGIISVTSIPDQASVYLDDHLTAATNENINSLTPKTYKVKIVKEGYIPWEKEIEVKEGLVTEIKATLFRSIPTVYPVTYSGVEYAALSPDGQKVVYVVPQTSDQSAQASKRSGIWAWTLASSGLGLGRSNDPRQIALSNGLDYTKAKFRWSPDSTQVLVDLPDRKLLLETDRLNEPARDITAAYDATVKSWDATERENKLAKLQLIQDPAIRKAASDSALIKWSSDESKILYTDPKGSDYKVTDLVLNKTYNLPKATSYTWLPDTEHHLDHLIMEEVDPTATDKAKKTAEATSGGSIKDRFVQAKISIIEIDGFNKSEIYVGNFEPSIIIPWPDGFRVLIISSLATATGSQPNLYGINLK